MPVITMVANDVPSAVDINKDSGTSTMGSKYTNVGTITNPPPIPNNPARKPANAPTSKQRRIKVNIIGLLIYKNGVSCILSENIFCLPNNAVNLLHEMRKILVDCP
nr:hypothetical protein HI0903 - Haemophilus influenzae (strain Rd KW20) [Haemophilus influenzae]